MRGDLSKITLGKFCYVHTGAVIHPPTKVFGKELKHLPVSIGDYVSLGEGSVIKAASIGSCVVIGKNAVVGERCILKDCCEIAPGAVVPSDTVIPPFTRWSGNPCKMEGVLNEGVWKKVEWDAENLFNIVNPNARK